MARKMEGKHTIITIPPDLMTVIDAAAAARRQSRTAFIVECVAKRLIDEGILDYTATVRRLLENNEHGVVALLAPKIVQAALIALLCVAPAYAADGDKPLSYAEKHPVVCYVPVKTVKLIKWIGKHTHTECVGTITKKCGAAVSDAVVHFGAVTEKYHPALQTTGYGSQIMYPVWQRYFTR